jgi:hypothetical protein
MAGTWNVTVDQGADFSAILTWQANGTVVPLVGWSAHLQVRNTWAGAAGSTVILDLSTSTTGITLGGTAGTITISIPNVTTSALAAPAVYAYDLKLTNGSGQVTRLLAGSFTVTPEVTV